MWKGEGLQVQMVNMLGTRGGDGRHEVKVATWHGEEDKVG